MDGNNSPWRVFHIIILNDLGSVFSVSGDSVPFYQFTNGMEAVDFSSHYLSGVRFMSLKPQESQIAIHL